MRDRQMHRPAAVLMMVLSVFLLVRPATAKVVAATEKEKKIAERVCKFLEELHLSRNEINDGMSSRVHKSFIDLIDPMKMYFLQSDIDEFAKSSTRHDDLLVKGELPFPFEVYNRFIERLKLRCEWSAEFAAAEQDFKKLETITLDPDSAKFAQNEHDAKERWRLWIKYELLRLMVSGETPEKARERIVKRYRNLLRNWEQVETDELIEMYLTSLTTSFDPHSTYMSPRTLEDFNISIQLSLEGIGALLSSEDGMTIVKEIVPGGAADKDGRLKPGDKIVGVAQGEGAEIEDLVDMKLRHVVKRIRGKAGTVVVLDVIPNEAQKSVRYTLTRQRIELSDREAKGEVISVPREGNAQAYKLGVIRLPSFYADSEALRRGEQDAKSATSDVRRILEGFKKQNVDGVVMDLRFNGGGLLNEAIDLTGLFIDQGPVVQVKDFKGNTTPYADEEPGAVYSGPLVVVVNKLSASASEIFAGAIKDYGRGVIVGDSSTHGKGTVQKIYELTPPLARFAKPAADNNMGAIKLTMQMFYRVNGDSTQNRGVESDIILPSPTDEEVFSEAKLDYALPFDRIDAAGFRAVGVVKEDMVKALRDRSQQRQKTDKELVALTERKQILHQRRERKTFEFNEDILRKEAQQLKEETDADEAGNEFQPKDSEKDKKFGADPYTKEVLAIMGDFVQQASVGFTKR